MERIGVLLFEEIPLAIKRFFIALKETPLLIAFLIISFCSATYFFSYQFGSRGVGILVGTLAFLMMALFAGIIFLFTRGYKAPEIEIKRPKFGLAFLLFYLIFLCILFTQQIPGYDLSQYIPGWKATLRFLYLQISQFLHANQWIAARVSWTIVCTIIEFLVPFTIFTLIFRYRSKQLGISIRFWWLGLILIAIFTCCELAGYTFFFFRFPKINRNFWLDFLFLLITSGFVEEFFSRGLLQPHLEALSRNRLNGVILTAIIFGLWHIPAMIGKFGFKPLLVITSCLGVPAIGALLVGYLYLKTRSLAPGALLHAWFNTSLFIIPLFVVL